MHHTFEMGVGPKGKLLTFTSAIQIVFMLCYVATSYACPEKCDCKQMGSLGFIIKCNGIMQVPRGLPVKTLMLDLSRNFLKAVPQDIFRNLTSLKSINLDNNNIKGGFYLPKSVTKITISKNRLSLDDLRTVLAKPKDVQVLDISENPIGPNLTADVFHGLEKMMLLKMTNCSLRYIQSGTFRSMKILSKLNLDNNLLLQIQASTLEGPGSELSKLSLENNNLLTIADGTFVRFSGLVDLSLNKNQLQTPPNLAGVTNLHELFLNTNQIRDISQLSNYNITRVALLGLSGNQIEQLPVDVFQKIAVAISLDLSLNNITLIPEEAFLACETLSELYLGFNKISRINRRTFAGLANLEILILIHNKLTFIPEYTFAETRLQLLFLHNNAIKVIDGNAFGGLSNLGSLTLFGNPFGLLPVTTFNNMTLNTTLAVSCKNLQQLPPGNYHADIKCAPSSSYRLVLYDYHTRLRIREKLLRSGFKCTYIKKGPDRRAIANCTFCPAGTHGDVGRCVPCPAGGFYQDEMGQVQCKPCSTGTYVSETLHPGKSPVDCQACPYGTLSNKPAGYRACRCLKTFYRVHRFGHCTECPTRGVNCANDTAILAPNYYWKWPNVTTRHRYENFVENIRTFGPGYNRSFNIFPGPLPKPVKCPYLGSCQGGICSTCNDGYNGTSCAMCSEEYYFRFNACLKCPRKIVTIISCLMVIFVFVAVFLLVLWGDSRSTENNRTVADVVMSCCKIVIGFYQVITGIFSALVRVQWPVILISMEKYLKFVEGNILQFAPLSCLDSQLRPDPFLQFVLAIGANILVVLSILLYLYLKKTYINKTETSLSEKMKRISNLKKSCYRNIFLFLLLTYPMTCKKIIQILPLGGVCVDVCYNQDKSDCSSLLRADYSIPCFTARHQLFWKIAAAFSIYTVCFPLLLLVLVCKYRHSETEEEIAFGFRVFFENYKEKFWFWETIEMYRKLILISAILCFEPEGHSQIAFTLIVSSAFGISYTLFRPIKGKFEDRLQAFVLWVIFFNVCLGAIYSEPDVGGNHEGSDYIFVSVLFVLLNSSVLILAVGKAILHMKFTWRTLLCCPKHGFHMIRVCLCCPVGENRYQQMQNVTQGLDREESDFEVH